MALSSHNNMRNGRRSASLGSSLDAIAGFLATGFAPEITRAKTSRNWAGFTGFVRQLAKAARENSGVSERTPIEVKSTRGIIIALGIFRISMASIKPSMPGICMSRMAKSKCSPPRSQSSAWAALCAPRAIMPHLPA